MANEVDPSWFSLAWSVITAGGVALLAIGGFSTRAATKGELAKKLYRDDGRTVFITRSECERSQTVCGARLEKTLADMRLDGERRHEDYLLIQRDMAEFVGSVRQFMDNHKNEG